MGSPRITRIKEKHVLRRLRACTASRSPHLKAQEIPRGPFGDLFASVGVGLVLNHRQRLFERAEAAAIIRPEDDAELHGEKRRDLGKGASRRRAEG